MKPHKRNGRDARARRQFAATERAAAEKPAPREQAERLDERLGRGVGATKERAKLAVAA